VIEAEGDGGLIRRDVSLAAHQDGKCRQSNRLQKSSEQRVLVLAVAVAVAQHLGGAVWLDDAQASSMPR
jgi:hypothetical protein